MSNTLNTRRARIRGSHWHGYEILCLAISVGKPAHEGADLAAAVEMIENIGKPCVIRLSDTLQRHNYMAAGAGVREAWDMSRKAGDEWLARNIAVLNRLSHKPEIVRWDSVLKHPDFDGVHYSFIRLSETNAIVAEALARDVETFLAKRQFGSNEERTIYEKCSRAFLLEETAGQTILGRQYSYACFYPGRSPEILHLARTRAVEEMPRGLDNTAFVKFTLETRKNLHPEFCHA